MKECDLDITDLLIQVNESAEALMSKLQALSLTITLSESCTGGLVSSLLTGISGASRVLWGSFVCYTEEAKISMLGLNQDELKKNGLVSKETAFSMASKALSISGAKIAASVTGIAGPKGDGSNTPVGTVWIAVILCDTNKSTVRKFHFNGCRDTVRLCAAISLFEEIQKLLPDL
jgi:PncC family amidohydrolase